jgi:hypothetical protein
LSLARQTAILVFIRMKTLVVGFAVVLGVTLRLLAAPVVPETIRCELAVIGGGSGGFGAALAAARLGVDVVLVERGDQLGGNSVRGGVNVWEPVVGATSFPFELHQRLKRETNTVGIYSMGRHLSTFDPAREPYRYPGGELLIDPKRTYLDTLQRHGLGKSDIHGVVFEPEPMSRAMLALLAETGRCRVLLRTEFKGVTMDDGRLRSATLQRVEFLNNRATAVTMRLVADHFVDATGDAVVCAKAGCKMMTGQEARSQLNEPGAPEKATARVNGVTQIYRVARVKTPTIEPLPEGIPAECWWGKHLPSAQISVSPNGDLIVNMLPTMEGAEFMQLGYHNAREECQRRVHAHWHDLQTRFAEFRSYRLDWIAPQLGVRETHRVVGEYVLTQHDLAAGLSGQKHPDIIAIADHPCDTHGGHNKGIQPLREPYGVPYRCLIPKGRRNLLIACRAASFSSLAASSCRLSRTMMQLGQAAGTAVALAKELKVDLPEVPAERLRGSLRQQNVQLEFPLSSALRKHLEREGPPPVK